MLGMLYRAGISSFALVFGRARLTWPARLAAFRAFAQKKKCGFAQQLATPIAGALSPGTVAVRLGLCLTLVSRTPQQMMQVLDVSRPRLPLSFSFSFTL